MRNASMGMVRITNILGAWSGIDIVVIFAFELIALMLVVLFFWQARLARNMAKKWPQAGRASD